MGKKAEREGRRRGRGKFVNRRVAKKEGKERNTALGLKIYLVLSPSRQPHIIWSLLTFSVTTGVRNQPVASPLERPQQFLPGIDDNEAIALLPLLLTSRSGPSFDTPTDCQSARLSGCGTSRCPSFRMTTQCSCPSHPDSWKHFFIASSWSCANKASAPSGQKTVLASEKVNREPGQGNDSAAAIEGPPVVLKQQDHSQQLTSGSTEDHLKGNWTPKRG